MRQIEPYHRGIRYHTDTLPAPRRATLTLERAAIAATTSAASSRVQHECWTAALPIAGAEMSAAGDAAAQWTPRTPLEASASVCICDEEDEDDYASDNWTAARSTLVAKSAKVQGAERVRVAGDAVVRGEAGLDPQRESPNPVSNRQGHTNQVFRIWQKN